MSFSLSFLVVSLSLILIFATLITANLKLQSRPAALASIFVFAYANIVLTSEILSTIYLLNSHWSWVFIQSLLVMAVGYVWWRNDRSMLLLNFRVRRSTFLASMKRHPMMWILGLSVVIAYVIGSGLILHVPPNNWDGMTYHAPRVAYWLQYETFLPRETNFHEARQVAFPPNAEIGLLWTVLVRGTSQFMGFVQWIAALSGMVAIFGLGRLLNYSREKSAFAALLWATLPLTLSESTSIQNDIVVSVFFLNTVYFFFLGLKSNNHKTFIVSGVAFGLCIGTKSTALLILPGFALGVLWLWLEAPRHLLKIMSTWVVACIAGFLLLGSYVYVTNYLAFENPLGPESLVEGHTNTSISRLTLMQENMTRYALQMVDFSPLPGRWGQPLTNVRNDLFSRFVKDPEIDPQMLWSWHQVNEDLSWFGVLSWLVLIPGIVVSSFQAVRHNDRYRLIIIITVVGFIILHSASQQWTPYKGRYYLLVATLGAPLMICSYRFHLVRWVVIGIAIFMLIGSLIYNNRKPMIGEQTIWSQKDYIDGLSFARPEYEDALRTFEREVPSDAVVMMITRVEWQYPYFGEHLTRYIIPIKPDPQATSLEALSQQQVKFLIGNPPEARSEPPPDYILIDSYYLESITDRSGFEEIPFFEKFHLFARVQ